MTDNNQKPLVPNYVPDVGRLVTDRYDFQSHVNGASFNHTAPGINLSPFITIESIQYSTVQSAIAALALIVSPNPTPNATTTSVGLIQLSGDIGGVGAGTATNVKVTGLQGRPVSILSPSSGQVLTWNGIAWAPTALTNSQGPASGDLSGTYPAPIVTHINGATVPAAGSLTIGNTIQVSGASALSYGPINLAGGPNYVTGVLPATNVSNLAGDVTGVINTNIVTKLQTHPVAATAPTTGYALTWTGSTWAPLPGATSLARGWVVNGSNIAPTDTSAHVVLSQTVTPTATGKFRVSIDGWANNTGVSVATVTLGISHGSGITTPDYAALCFAYMTFDSASPSNIGSIATVAGSVDLDKISSPVIFPLGTPVIFNIVMQLGISGNTIIFSTGTLHFTVQEVF